MHLTAEFESIEEWKKANRVHSKMSKFDFLAKTASSSSSSWSFYNGFDSSTSMTSRVNCFQLDFILFPEVWRTPRKGRLSGFSFIESSFRVDTFEYYQFCAKFYKKFLFENLDFQQQIVCNNFYGSYKNETFLFLKSSVNPPPCTLSDWCQYCTRTQSKI